MDDVHIHEETVSAEIFQNSNEADGEVRLSTNKTPNVLHNELGNGYLLFNNEKTMLEYF